MIREIKHNFLSEESNHKWRRPWVQHCSYKHKIARHNCSCPTDPHSMYHEEYNIRWTYLQFLQSKPNHFKGISKFHRLRGTLNVIIYSNVMTKQVKVWTSHYLAHYIGIHSSSYILKPFFWIRRIKEIRSC